MSTPTIFLTVNLETGKAVSSLKEAKKAIQELEANLFKLKLAGKDIGDKEYDLLALKIRNAKTEVQKFNQELRVTPSFTEKIGKSFSESLGKATDAISGTIGGLFAFDKILGFLNQSSKAFQEAELNARRLQSAVSANGGISKDFDTLIKQSADLQNNSIFSDDDIQNVQRAALQFGLTSEQVEKLTPKIVDFASATGQDLQSALDAVLKGTEGSEKALKLYGIQIDSTKGRMENLDLISQQLTKSFEGQAAVIGDTATGAVKKFDNEIGDLMENVGEKYIPILQTLKIGLLSFGRDLFDLFSGKLFSSDEPDVFKKYYEFTNKVAKGLDDKALNENLKNQANLLQGLVDQAKKLKPNSDDWKVLGKQIESSKGILKSYTDEQNKRIASTEKGTKAEINLTNFSIEQLNEKRKVAQLSNLATDRDLVDSIDKEIKARTEAGKKSVEIRKKQIDDEKKALDDQFKSVQGQNKVDESTAGNKGSSLRIAEERKSLEDELKYYTDNRNKLIEVGKNTALELDGITSDYNEKITAKNAEFYNAEIAELNKSTDVQIALAGENSEKILNIKIASLEKEKEFLKNQPATVVNADDRVLKEKVINDKILVLIKQGLESKNQLRTIDLQNEKTRLETELNLVGDDVKKKADLEKKLFVVKNDLDKNAIDKSLEYLQYKKDHGIALTNQELANYELYIKQKEKLDSDYTVNAKVEGDKRKENEKVINQALLDASGTLLNGLIEQSLEADRKRSENAITNVHSRLDEELSAIDIRQQKAEGTYVQETATEKKFNAERKKAREKAAKEEANIKNIQAKKEHEAAIILGIINTALSVIKALPNYPLAIATGIAGAAEVALIASQPVPKYATGTVLGASHSEGGIKLFDTKSKQNIGEIEGGEVILTKKVSENPALLKEASRINELAGGKSFVPKFRMGEALNFYPTNKFASGTVIPNNVNITNSVDLSEINNAMKELKTLLKTPIKSYVIGQEITNTQYIDSLIEKRSITVR